MRLIPVNHPLHFPASAGGLLLLPAPHPLPVPPDATARSGRKEPGPPKSSVAVTDRMIATRMESIHPLQLGPRRTISSFIALPFCCWLLPVTPVGIIEKHMTCQLPLRHKSPEYHYFSVEAFPQQIVIEEYSRIAGEYSAGDPPHGSGAQTTNPTAGSSKRAFPATRSSGTDPCCLFETKRGWREDPGRPSPPRIAYFNV